MAEKVLMKGNEALAEAAIRAGCRLFFGYPITPQTELAAYMSKYLPPVGGTYLQAESEVAAINMVYGAAATGARVMTSSSSPGISLKQEGISYMIGSDLPGLIVNIQRGGPGLGSIQAAQSDYWQATKGVGHGDGHILVFAPSTVQEMADLVALAFDRADKYRMPAMILADGLLGQMMEPIELPDPLDQPPIEKPWALTGHGNARPHNIVNSLSLDPQRLEEINIERFQRYEQVKANEQLSEEYLTEDAEVVVVAYGAAARVAKSAVRAARADGVAAGLLRLISLWPYPVDKIEALADGSRRFLALELSQGQMVEDLRLAVNGRGDVHFFGHSGGIAPTPEETSEVIRHIAAGGRDWLVSAGIRTVDEKGGQ
ncbi:MAG: 3-methyl-2-oxobutanoate dehydrogenase subunit VorB [Coriobacteriia bacterium]|nr:3-methyl-2-oxobutanoate dehydrogenase subunit VorB [Coriobacteriia bacterium]